MTSIFPANPQANDTHHGYKYNGFAWKIVGIDLTADYPEITNGHISDSVIPATIARVDDVNTSLGDYIELTEKGEPLGVAELDASGFVPLTQLNIDLLPSQTNNSGKFLTTNGSAPSWADVDALPSQAGNNGKYLTTNGSVASWAVLDLLPSQTGNTGKFLTTDGSSTSWATVDLTAYAPLNSPTLTTPNIGAATGTSLTTTGSVVSHITILTPTFASNAYTLVIGDDGDLLMLDNGATDGTVYVPTDATYNFTIGTQINLVQKGTGQITIQATTPGTTTINYTPGNKLRTQWSGATLIKTAANEWLLMGDLEL